MNSLRRLIPSLLFVWTLSPPVLAAHAHVHGQATLDVAVDGGDLSIHLDSPLESLLGFEHTPQNAKQLAAAKQMIAKLRAMQNLFLPTLAAGCTATNVALQSEALDPKLLSGSHKKSPAKPAHKGHDHGGHEDHADLAADYNFQCAKAAQLHGMDIRLFDAFPKLRQIDVQLVSPRGQSAVRLTPERKSLNW